MSLSPSSPPIGEPDVPEPFLVDVSDIPDEEPLGSRYEGKDSQLRRPSQDSPFAAASDEISLAPAVVGQADLLAFANVNKDVPPPPTSSGSDDEDDSEDDIPEIIVPGIVAPAMFLPIPNTDPLTTLLTKYISPPEARPVRDLTGDWQRSDFHSLVMTNSWRALARMARDRIVTSDPNDLSVVLDLWYLRLSSLARLRLYNQTAAECTNLFSALNAAEPLEGRQYLFDNIVPFELEVMYARLIYWAGDHMSYLDVLNDLLKRCKLKARLAGINNDRATAETWIERGCRMSLIIASQLIELKDFLAAAKHLEPLCVQGATTSPTLRSAVARTYLQGGHLAKAAHHFAAVAADPTADAELKAMNEVLLASARGDWVSAGDMLRRVLERDSENYAAMNNLAVALLGQGRLKEGIQVLEAALQSSPSTVVVVEPFLFNLSTLYELRSAAALQKKRDLLVEVAKWSGDGLKTVCLKMPSN